MQRRVPDTKEGQAKIRTLFLAANPCGTKPLQLDEEIREITAKIRTADYRDVMELVSAWAVRPNDLLQLLLQHKPQIVHFSGHGSSTGEVVLVDDKTGTPKPISTAAMRALFKTLKENVRLVVLNACYSKTQGMAIVENIDCAVGMSTAIGDEAAIVFAASFYGALGFGRSVNEAFEIGKTALLLEGIPEDKTPDLLCRAGIDASKIFLVAPEPPPEASSAYGITFKKIVWKHHYHANGDFQGEIEFFVKNISNDNIIMLPPHSAGWFGWDVQPPRIRTKVYGEEGSAYSIAQKHFSESKDIRTDLDGIKRKVTSYLWQFDINPPLAPQQSLHYGIIAETMGTELEAFTSDGSFAGMWSPYSAAELSCELYAPKGYKFKKETQFVRDRAGIMKDFTGVSRSEFMGDDTKVIWSVEKPSPNLEYLIKVVIVKTN